MDYRFKDKSQEGFSLVELLVALTIFAVGLLGIAGLQMKAINFNNGSNTRTALASVGQGILEEILAFDSDDPRLAAAGTAVWDLDTGSAATTLALPGSGTYSATWTVAVNDPQPNISRITVTVQSSTGNSISLTSFKGYD